jgi:basic membrane lipoprotein Med (substrate-binding protein (PBP1-ABC) superfamily)
MPQFVRSVLRWRPGFPRRIARNTPTYASDISLTQGDFMNRFMRAVCMLSGLTLLLALAACSSDLPGRQTATPTTTTLPQATATEVPTPTITPPPPLVILWTGEGTDPQTVSALQALLEQLARQAGLRFQTVNSPMSPDLVRQAKVVVAVSPGSELEALTSAAPDTQFLAFSGGSGLKAGKNLSLSGGQDARLDQLGFLAGYLAAVVTQDWRVGVISQADSGPEKAAQAAFINGAVFFCGLCRPAYPPFVQYPVFAQLTAGASVSEGQSAVDMLISQGVETIYVTPGATSQALLEYLAEKGIHIIGSTPPSQAVKDDWVATVTSDWESAVKNAWPDLLAGQGGHDLSSSIVVEDANPALFSPGRQQLVEETLSEMLAGRIDTGVDPQTGERTP